MLISRFQKATAIDMDTKKIYIRWLSYIYVNICSRVEDPIREKSAQQLKWQKHQQEKEKRNTRLNRDRIRPSQDMKRLNNVQFATKPQTKDTSYLLLGTNIFVDIFCA